MIGKSTMSVETGLSQARDPVERLGLAAMHDSGSSPVSKFGWQSGPKPTFASAQMATMAPTTQERAAGRRPRRPRIGASGTSAGRSGRSRRRPPGIGSSASSWPRRRPAARWPMTTSSSVAGRPMAAAAAPTRPVHRRSDRPERESAVHRSSSGTSRHRSGPPGFPGRGFHRRRWWARASATIRSRSVRPRPRTTSRSQACSISVMTCDESSAVWPSPGPPSTSTWRNSRRAKRIEARERLVEEEDPGPRPEGERQPDLGLLAARELVRLRGERNPEPLHVRPGEIRVEASSERDREARCARRWSARDRGPAAAERSRSA